MKPLNPFQQIAAIAFTEIRFGLRRGMPVIGMAAVCGMFSLVTFWIRLGYPDMPSTAPEGVRYSALIQVWPVLLLIVPLILPVVCILAIPADREYHTDMWLRSLPVDGWVYLAGKILGTLAVVLGIWLVGLFIHFCLFRLLVGPIRLGIDIELALTSGLPLLLWNCLVGVLVGTWLPSRRSAILVGVLTGIANLAVWEFIFPGLFRGNPYSPGVEVISPFARVGQDTLADFVLTRHNLLSNTRLPVTWQAAATTLAAAALVLALLALAARAWLHWHDNI